MHKMSREDTVYYFCNLFLLVSISSALFIDLFIAILSKFIFSFNHFILNYEIECVVEIILIISILLEDGWRMCNWNMEATKIKDLL